MTESATKNSRFLKLPSKIHFLGIGGAGMNPLAGICLKNGVKVTGSDSTPNKNQDELRALGADIWTPHSLEELKKRDLPEVCAYSTAILPSNPEFAYLKENGVEFWHRSDLLQRIANQFEKQIVISGTHGKTTTTAMLIWILEKAGLKPCWVLGGVLKGLGSYGWNNDQREVFVFEGDESDQSFLKSNPYIGLVTSLEPDHLENYNNSFEVQIEKFKEFAKKSKHFFANYSTQRCFQESILKAYCVSLGMDDLPSGYKSYLTSKNFPIDYPDELFEILLLEKNSTVTQAGCWGMERGVNQLELPLIFGEHNQVNALGALLVAEYCRIPGLKKFLGIVPLDNTVEDLIPLLKDFPGIYRRFEIIGKTEDNITVIDDYAHHPTEVKAAIAAGKRYLNDQKLGGKLIVAFQPHLPTRLRDLWKEFTECFEEADVLFLNDLYIARGKPIEGIDSLHLAKEIKHHNLTHVEGSPKNLVNPLIDKAKAGDLILLLGAGDITYIRETLFEQLRQCVSKGAL